MLNHLRKIDEYLAILEKYVIQFCVFIIALLMSSQVLFRYLFNKPIYWVEEVSILSMIFMTFLGVGLLMKKNALISVNILNCLINKSIQNLLSILITTAVLVILTILLYYSVGWIIKPATHTEVCETIGMQKWIIYSIIPISIAIMIFHYIVYLLELIIGIKGEAK